ncbi:carotenoid 9,10(9',10')-cleavage dioxygenase [Medicago truncatula]|uniref:carotenoid 9,10-dioxygenase n=1 Tax=Medicago truncatula TaxID=3880 RepID=A0A072TNV1_MEDTR|nr:carotenoid 9,10(9',10')-cleavage dioxygenase [Medicago truncatula]
MSNISSSRLNTLRSYRGSQVFKFSTATIHSHKPICVKIKSFSLRRGIVKVEPKPRKCFSSKAVDLLEKLVVKLFYDSSLPHHWLAGNFAPVKDETPPTKDLPVKGYLPDCLNGEFVRVGPNPKFSPVAGYHWFDGDGMIHGLRIKDGKATYVSRFVRTSRLKQEEYFGGSKFMKVGDIKGLLGVLMVTIQILREKLKILDVSYGTGTANTGLVYHNAMLLALSERDKPYAIKVFEDGDLHTLGMLDYDKRLDHYFTAHPKVDPFTGDMFTFGYSQTPPYITYRVISKDGYMHDPVPITISNPIMVHDFAITENYAIFMDLPVYFRPKEMVKNKRLVFSFDSTKKARFGVLPRYAKDDKHIRWFELPNCFIFHNANAWEEEDEVVLITCRLKNLDLDMVAEDIKDKLKNFSNELYEMRFNMKTGKAAQKKLSTYSVDFPRVNERYTGRKQKYVYGTILGSNATGIIKFDLNAEPNFGKTKLEVGGNIHGLYDLGPGTFCSDAIYVPRVPGTDSDEDDGYLIFFVHDENTRKSSVHVIDAKTMSADPVAVVELPQRVPYGFHAFFVTEDQLQEQAKL